MICNVRELKPSEIERVLPLIKKLFPNADLEINEDDIFFIAEAENRIVGFLHLVEYEKYIYVKGVGVDPRYQNKGYGTALMNKIDEITYLSAKKIYLKVKATNPAVLLYEQSGFMMKTFGVVYTLVKKANN
jgi:ribosomal protein S18 acetylase RimI-like enzyme